MTRFLLIFLLAFTSFAPAQEDGSKKSLPDYWMTDFSAARAKAAETKKPLLAVFSTTWCGPCQALVKNVYPVARVEKALEEFVCVYVDGDEHRDLTKKYKVRGFPTFIFEDHEGNETRREAGAPPAADDFIAFVRDEMPPAPPMPEKPAILGEGVEDPQAVAILKGFGEGAASFSGKVTVTEADVGDEMDLMFMGPPVESSPPFQGDFHFMRTAEGESIFVSSGRAPGLALYRNGDECLSRVTARAEGGPSLATAWDDLRLVLDAAALGEWAEGGSRWKKSNEKDATTIYTTTITPTMFEPVSEADDDGMMIIDPLAVKVIRGEMSIVVNAQAQVQKLDLRVIRSNPAAAMAIMMEDAEESGAEVLDFEALQDMDPIDGAVHHYTFVRGDVSQSKRLSRVLADFRAIME